MPRLYHLVAINERTGSRVRLTSYPVEHHLAVNNKSRFNPHKDVRIQLDPVPSSSSLRKKTSKFIVEEIRTGKYPRKQAVAIGLSRARAATKRESMRRSLENMLKKYQ